MSPERRGDRITSPGVPVSYGRPAPPRFWERNSHAIQRKGGDGDRDESPGWDSAPSIKPCSSDGLWDEVDSASMRLGVCQEAGRY